jgi:hypothetical protein
VYVHRKPYGEIFYVGKGTKLRAWSKHGRNPLWKAITAKYGYTVEVVEDNLVAKVALELEEFIISYHKLKIFGGTLANLTTGGEGVCGVPHSEETKKKISITSSGSSNGNSDKNSYTFVNFHTQEKYTGTRQDFTLKYGISVADLFKGKVLCVFSWCLESNIHKITKPKYDCTVYNFISVDGTKISATRRDFKQQTGIDPKQLFKSEKGRYKSVAGWSLLSTL